MRIVTTMIAAAALTAAAWTAAAAAPLSCTTMIDAASGKQLVQEGQCTQRVTSGSTFKVAISLMGYDSGILRDEHTPRLPFREGYIDWDKGWRVDTDPASWMRDSVVWYSQQVTTRLGAARFQRYVDSFDYGNRNVAGDPGKENGLTLSWISSSLEISPLEQVAFLRKLVKHTLPVKARAFDMTARIMKLRTTPNGWTIYGKPGTGSPSDPGDPNPYGWFVGWATKGARTIVFARLQQDEKEEATRAGLRVRDAFLRELPARLDHL